MGSFCSADVVNGRNLAEGQPVVAFMVNSQNGSHPLSSNANAMGHSSGHFFAIESLPIFGTATDGGRVEVQDETQLAVRLALRMTGTSSWEELSEKAFTTREGVRFLGRSEPEGQPNVTTRRVYGLCLMHRETYDHLVLLGRSPQAKSWARDGFPGEYRDPAIRQRDIDEVKAVLTSCMMSPANLHRLPKDELPQASKDGFWAAANLGRVCSLSADHHVLREVLPGHANLPTLMTAMSTSDGSQVGSDLREVLRVSGILGNALLEGDYSLASEVPGLDALLGLLWDVIHLRTRMYEVHAHFYPSFYAGQDCNFPSVMEMARATLQGVWSEMLALQVDIDGDAESVDLDAQLAGMEATVAQMREALFAARGPAERSR